MRQAFYLIYKIILSVSIRLVLRDRTFRHIKDDSRIPLKTVLGEGAWVVFQDQLLLMERSNTTECVIFKVLI